MVVLLDIGRQSVLAKVPRQYRKPTRIPSIAAMAQQRHLKAAPAQSDPTSQVAKSSSTWPESISTFFRTSRQPDTPAFSEVVVESSGNGGGGTLPPSKDNSGGDGDDTHSESGAHPDELLNLAEVRLRRDAV